jgi:hypothetical protein
MSLRNMVQLTAGLALVIILTLLLLCLATFFAIHICIILWPATLDVNVGWLAQKPWSPRLRGTCMYMYLDRGRSLTARLL